MKYTIGGSLGVDPSGSKWDRSGNITPRQWKIGVRLVKGFQSLQAQFRDRLSNPASATGNYNNFFFKAKNHEDQLTLNCSRNFRNLDVS